MPMARVWNGLEIEDRIHRASGRAIVGIGMAVAVQTKMICHVWKQGGTLRRSIHVSTPMEPHDDDQESAEMGMDLLSQGMGAEAFHGPLGFGVEVGSWVDYACVEWVGRRHPGITEGLSAVRGIQADRIVQQAFREEGLK